MQLAALRGNKILKNGTVMTDLNALKIFAEVVAAKSFTEAARRRRERGRHASAIRPARTRGGGALSLREEEGLRLRVGFWHKL